MVKTLLKKCLPEAQYRSLARTAKNAQAWRHQDDLVRLATLYGTDKWGSHWYAQHYQRYFGPLRERRLNVLEIGVGGYNDRDSGGHSLRMWKAYFRNSRIVGIDIEDKSRLRENRIDIRQCDQSNSEMLMQISREYGGFDIIIDDGSHLNNHVINTFHVLFPLLRENGIYAVEDTQTAYWPTWGGGIDRSENSVSFFARLVNGLNHAEYPLEAYEPDYFDKNITEIAFFHNLIFIRKGQNNEGTNLPKLIEHEVAAMREASASKEVAS